MATHSSVLAWRIPGTGSLVGCRLWRHTESDTTEATGSDGKPSAYNAGRSGLNPWVGKIPWRRKWQPTPVFLPGESQGQRSLLGAVYGVTQSRTRLTQLSSIKSVTNECL